MKRKIYNVVNEEVNKHILKEYYENYERFSNIDKAIRYIEENLNEIRNEIIKSKENGNEKASVREATFVIFNDAVRELRNSFNAFSRHR